MTDRLTFGIPGLDSMLRGGLLPGRPYLLTGPAGSGKTILGMHFLLEGVRRGQRGLYVALEEPPNEVRDNLATLGWDAGDVDVLDAISDVRTFQPKPVMEISTDIRPARFGDLPPTIRRTPDEGDRLEVTVQLLQTLLKETLQRRPYPRVVIDSMTALRFFTMRPFEEAVATQSFYRFLTELKVTSLLIGEIPREDYRLPDALLARGEIRLHRYRDPNGIQRFVSIVKYKGSSHDEGLVPFDIGPGGISVHRGG